LFLQGAPDADIASEQVKLGGHSWREVTPLEFYRTLVDHLTTSPEREEAYLEAMEETLEQWERASGE
jgi:hypothetical protein